MINNENNIDITNLYFREIKKYDLLSKEEERLILKNIKLAKDLNILDEKKELLDIEKLFTNLMNNANYLVIINSLINYFQTKDIYKSIYELLCKYKNMSVTLNRALNMNELVKYFNIKDELFIIENIEEEVNNFLLYRYSYDKLLLANLRLVAKIAHKYNSKYDLLDLINEGNMGLIEAIKAFDINRGERFSTYAVYWIKLYITRFISNRNTMIRYPINKQQEYNEIIKKIKILEQQYNKEMSLNEISSILNISLKKLIDCQNYVNDILYFNSIKDFDPEEYIVDDNNPYNTVENNFLKNDINMLLDKLSNTEQKVIKMYFGIDSEYKTYKEIESILNLKPFQASTIRRGAFNKMQKIISSDESFKSLESYINY